MKHSIALLLFLAACSSTDQRSADENAKEAWAAYEPYAQCVIIASDALASQNEDPYYLVVAAKSSCGERQISANAQIDRIYGADSAQAVKASFDRRTTEAAIARIVKTRARAS